MRTLTIGPPSVEVRGSRRRVPCRPECAVLEAMGPGVAASDAADAGWRELKAAGDDLVFHGTFGYGIGAGFPPNWADGSGFIRSDADSVLEPGMVFHHPVAVRRLGRVWGGVQRDERHYRGRLRGADAAVPRQLIER